ncbi:MAG: FAD:protein FMN transferase [Kiritimatiellae bacterium]|nr:FAD:protein FMN transferase [Kiritimatiellia bacterium]
MTRRLSTLALCLTALLTGCRESPRIQRRAWMTMGTVAALQCDTATDIAALQREADALYGTVMHTFSAWETNSTLGQVNAAAGGDQEIPVPPAFAELLNRALILTRQSEGAFNPLVGPLMHLWGFHRDTVPKRPSPEALAAIKPLLDWKRIETRQNPPTLRLPLKGMRLDLGAIAKGYAVDRVWSRFQEAGHTNILIDLGGNLRCLGEAAPGRGGWRTAIRNPFDPAHPIGLFLLRPGEAVATSGNYERFVTIDGKRYAHILDARTGEPVAGIASVTVIAPTAEQADALSTTLFILGPEQGKRFLARHAPACEALWLPDTPEHPTVIATPGFQARMLP